MIRMLLPLGVFVTLLALLFAGLFTADQRDQIDSPLVGKPVPAFELPTLHDSGRRVNKEQMLGQPFVLNVWGSWCPSCRVEHPLITRLGQEIDVPLVGLNWKDERPAALRWLGQFGDAWDFHLFDQPGDFGIDLGVYGAPETFVIDHTGVIRDKHIGPVTEESYDHLIRLVAELKMKAANS
jgi:cytochrome c biogenesis protein CcmG/thiol:disulfide interchange protein DsbE